jgi:hypothetical protein
MKWRDDHFVISRFDFGKIRGEKEKTLNGHFWLPYRTADSYINGLQFLFFFSRSLHCLFFFDLRILIIPLVYSNFSNHCLLQVYILIYLKSSLYKYILLIKRGKWAVMYKDLLYRFCPCFYNVPIIFLTCSYGVVLFHFHVNVENLFCFSVRMFQP